MSELRFSVRADEQAIYIDNGDGDLLVHVEMAPGVSPEVAMASLLVAVRQTAIAAASSWPSVATTQYRD